MEVNSVNPQSLPELLSTYRTSTSNLDLSALQIGAAQLSVLCSAQAAVQYNTVCATG